VAPIVLSQQDENLEEISVLAPEMPIVRIDGGY
jgi:hypothetical protein